MCRLSVNLRTSASWNPQGRSNPVQGLLYLFISVKFSRWLIRHDFITSTSIHVLCRLHVHYWLFLCLHNYNRWLTCLSQGNLHFCSCNWLLRWKTGSPTARKQLQVSSFKEDESKDVISYFSYTCSILNVNILTHCSHYNRYLSSGLEARHYFVGVTEVFEELA